MEPTDLHCHRVTSSSNWVCRLFPSDCLVQCHGHSASRCIDQARAGWCRRRMQKLLVEGGAAGKAAGEAAGGGRRPSATLVCCTAKGGGRCHGEDRRHPPRWETPNSPETHPAHS